MANMDKISTKIDGDRRAMTCEIDQALTLSVSGVLEILGSIFKDTIQQNHPLCKHPSYQVQVSLQYKLTLQFTHVCTPCGQSTSSQTRQLVQPVYAIPKSLSHQFVVTRNTTLYLNMYPAHVDMFN
ncbi:hypothetical protein CEXT_452771 [Caerostris extrusa]|uniref:Uncharacterized protein n=1 Tax=Caerostris extrusa TaxID=172846 RepID=A0AAV4MTN9_CAEEX|nr:hypothetical protein CEXT_452771 [Caerostris extrusa]